MKKVGSFVGDWWRLVVPYFRSKDWKFAIPLLLGAVGFSLALGALTLLLLDRGKILFEGYKSPATDQTAQHSQSMSKSLTAYMVGILLCDGRIRSLGDRAEAYVPQLKGTVYGDATIKQLLMMSSGAAPATSSR